MKKWAWILLGMALMGGGLLLADPQRGTHFK